MYHTTNSEGESIKSLWLQRRDEAIEERRKLIKPGTYT